jgi:anthranilate synthase component 2
MILLIDNYDSFSYNLYQLIGIVTPDIKVIRNDEMTVREIEALNPSHIILSPGPGKPEDAGVCEDVVRELAGKIPIMGVCLGHQAICEVYGATVTYAKRLMHGKQSVCTLEDDKIFNGIGDSGKTEHVNGKKMKVARYHSLAAKSETIPDCLKVIAVSDDDGEIMAVKHKDYPVYGLQFHPESILTPEGIKIIQNFINKNYID